MGSKPLIPLSTQVEIVDATGRPTPQFCRVLQKLAIGTSLTQGSDGTVGLAAIAAKTLLANKTAGIATPTSCTLSEILDFIGSATRGDILFRGASGWQRLAAGTSGYVLTSAGPGADIAWAAATGGGGGGTPTVRSSNITSSSASSYTINWPTGTIAGDVVVVFGGHGFGINIPTGWTSLDKQDGGNFNGATFARVMTSGDITTGSVTITTAGGYNGVFSLVTITGSTMTGLRSPFFAVRSGAGVSSVSLSNTVVLSTDLVLAFISNRGNSTNTFSAGITSLQTVSASEASGNIGNFTGTLSKLGLAETGSFSTAGSGYYTMVMGLR